MTEQSPKSVLLVDDDKFLLEMYGMKFTKEGFAVQTSFAVHDALAQLRKGYSPDVVIFDIVMPDEDGFSFLETMRAEKLAEGAYKIALTNQSTDAEKKRALDLGADEFIVKATMIPSEVVAAVQQALTKGKSA